MIQLKFLRLSKALKTRKGSPRGNNHKSNGSPMNRFIELKRMILETKNLTKVFNSKSAAEVTAVNGINFELQQGEIAMIMGPSGSGKTTFITMIGGLLKPTSGAIIFDGHHLESENRQNLTAIRRHEIGFIFQSFNLLQNLTALENVSIAAFGISNPYTKASELLTKLGLKDRLNAKPADLSGGEKQRVAIARSLINNPKLILADEPTANLDKAHGHEVMRLLCSIGCEQNKSIIIVSHDERIKEVAHRVLYIEDGKLTREEKGNHDQVCSMKSHTL